MWTVREYLNFWHQPNLKRDIDKNYELLLMVTFTRLFSFSLGGLILVRLIETKLCRRTGRDNVKFCYIAKTYQFSKPQGKLGILSFTSVMRKNSQLCTSESEEKLIYKTIILSQVMFLPYCSQILEVNAKKTSPAILFQTSA